MFEAFKETLDPKGGHGMSETMLFIIIMVILVAIIVMNIIGIDIDPSLTAGLGAFIGWIVGNNNKDKWDGEERRDEEMEENNDISSD